MIREACRIPAYVVWLCLFITAMPVVHGQNEGVCAYDEGKDPVCGHYKSTVSLLLARESMLRYAEPDTATDLLHCFLDVELDTAARTIGGTNTLTVKSLSAGLTTFTLNLRNNMTVNSVTVNGTAGTFNRLGDTVEITLDRVYGNGESFTVSVAYQGSPISDGFGSFNWGTHGDPPYTVVSTLSEPWYAGTWWPCKESLNDKFTMDMWITVPSWMVATSNGSLLGTDPLPGDRLRYRWKENYPIATYLVAITATNYVQWTETYDYADGSMPVVFYAYPESETTMRNGTADLLTQLATFSRPDVYGQYPFINEKYGIVQFPWGGGMEHQTLTSQGAFSSWLNAHELAHQWWGDAVTCATWHDIWLNEGFATFSEALYLEKKPGGTPSAYLTRMNQRKPYDYSGSVYVYNTDMLGTIFSTNNVYNKGAWAVHMLRHALGDATFFQTLATYRSIFEGGSATTEDFRQVAQNVSGRDLSWYFNEWIYGVGAPYYRYGWQSVRIGSQDYVRLYIQQYQTQYPIFTMPIDITITAGGVTATQSVWNDTSIQWYLLPANGTASGVQFDKDQWILRAIASSVAYVNGPPKLIASAPIPGSMLPHTSAPASIHLTFSEGITYSASDFVVTGTRTGPHTPNVVYDAAAYGITLNFASPLPAGDTYEIRVADSIRSAAVNFMLDGEMTNPLNPVSYPSGNGKPGGSAVFRFSVASAADFNLDGHVDNDDYEVFAACYSGPAEHVSGDCLHVDFNGDHHVDANDFDVFSACYNGPANIPGC